MNYSNVSNNTVSNIRGLLGSNRESIETLSRSTGISLSTLKRRLLNKAPFTLDEITAIAKHFGITPGMLVDGDLFKINKNTPAATGVSTK